MTNPMLSIPVPPSANRMYTPTRHKHKAKSNQYRNWLSNHAFVCRATLGDIVPKQPVSVEILANINRQRDLDNIIKPTLDLLQYSGTLPDDRYVDEINAIRFTGENSWLEKNMMQVNISYTK